MATDDDAVAADIICSLRGADLAGWTPPWSKRAEAAAGELSWPAVARGKRSRRRSPSSAPAPEGKGRRCAARSSPPSPLDYSAGSASLRSGASTSGGEDGGGFCSPWHGRAAPATTKGSSGNSQTQSSRGCGRSFINSVESIRRPQLTFPAPPPRPTGQRQRKKMRLPEVQQLVRSLTAENGSLHEMRALQRACSALAKENDKLEARVEQRSNPRNATALKEQKGKQQIDQQPPMTASRYQISTFLHRTMLMPSIVEGSQDLRGFANRITNVKEGSRGLARLGHGGVTKEENATYI